MKYVNVQWLLLFFAIGGMATITGAILIEGMVGVYCLIATSVFMSLMFQTIYGIALRDVGEAATLEAAVLVMAIVGGALMFPLRDLIIDMETISWLPVVNVSFILPFICFLIIAGYGYHTYKTFKSQLV